MACDAFLFSLLCTANRRAAKLLLPTVPDHDSQLSSVTPSQSASQILLLGSDESADPSTIQNLGSPHRPVLDAPRGSFSIEIPAAHSIDDHDAVHDNIPSSRLIIEGVKQKKAGSSDSDEGGKLEVRENKPFVHPPRNVSPRSPVPEKRHTLTRNPSNAATVKSASTHRASSVHQANVRLQKQKQKPASDVGTVPTLVVFKPGDTVGTPYKRKRTSSGSLFGTITSLFKPKRASADYDAVYTGPTATSFANGWQTRADRDLTRGRKQSNSSEEDLPSSVKRKSRAFGGEKGPAHKRSSTIPGPPIATQPESSRTDKGKARAPLTIQSPMSPTSYAPTPSLERSSSSARSRETAANTALNARTNGTGFVNGAEHPSLGRSESKRSTTSSGNGGGRKRESQMDNPLNMGEVTRQSGGSRPNDSSGGGGGLVLPPANFEVVRAPPSVTQAPVLLGSSPSPLVLPPTRRPSSSSGGAPSVPPKHGTVNTNLSYLPAPTSPRGTTTVNGESPRPLKSALRNSSLSPSPSPAPAIHGSAGSTGSSSGTPTMPASPRLPEIHAPIPRPPPPTSMPSEILPRPNRLSDIPASNRNSMASENDYETCYEDFEDAEEGTDSATPPATPSPMPASEKPQPPPAEGEHRSSLLSQRTLANGSPPADASVSSSSTQRRKSVRMIIHPTVTVALSEEYTEPPTPPAYNKGKESERYKATGSRQTQMHSRSTSGSGTSHRSEVSRGAGPSAWETRVEHQRSVWDDSDTEDEGYRAAKSALQRASAL